MELTIVWGGRDRASSGDISVAVVSVAEGGGAGARIS